MSEVETVELRTKLDCVREVRLGVQSHRADEAAVFYAQLFDLSVWPPRRDVLGGSGLGPSTRGLFLEARHDPEVDPLRRRLALTVTSLRELRRRLDSAGVRHSVRRGLALTDDRCVFCDPIGHCIEVRETRAV